MTRDINYAIIFSMNAMLKGVYLARKKDNSIYYCASITYRRKHISLGSFDTEDSANRAYEEADRLLRSETDTIDSYENTCALPFEKWVILLNFRDTDFILLPYLCAWANSSIIIYLPSYVLKFVLIICSSTHPTKS